MSRNDYDTQSKWMIAQVVETIDAIIMHAHATARRDLPVDPHWMSVAKRQLSEQLHDLFCPFDPNTPR